MVIQSRLSSCISSKLHCQLSDDYPRGGAALPLLSELVLRYNIIEAKWQHRQNCRLVWWSNTHLQLEYLSNDLWVKTVLGSRPTLSVERKQFCLEKSLKGSRWWVTATISCSEESLLNSIHGIMISVEANKLSVVTNKRKYLSLYVAIKGANLSTAFF
jgi:hypothetical protein